MTVRLLPEIVGSSAVAALRAHGEIVVELLPGELSSEGPPCDRQLVECQGRWLIEAINRNGSP